MAFEFKIPEGAKKMPKSDGANMPPDDAEENSENEGSSELISLLERALESAKKLNAG